MSKKAKAVGKSPAKAAPGRPAGPKPEPTTTTPPLSQTKAALVVSLLARADGATASELISATGWQLHSLRAFISGLRKRGHAVSRSREKGEARYVLPHAGGCR